MSSWSEALVEFVGGPCDGRIMNVTTPPMGRPPHTLRLPVEQPLTLLLMEKLNPTYPTPNQALYEFDAISDERHTWIYTYRGMR